MGFSPFFAQPAHCVMRNLCLVLMVLLLCLGMPEGAIAQAVDSAQAIDSVESIPAVESLFELNCAACHAGGGNIIRRGKNLKQKALMRNGYGEVGAIAQLVTQGKGIMPAYADRLSEEEIGAIAQYVLDQAESGW